MMGPANMATVKPSSLNITLLYFIYVSGFGIGVGKNKERHEDTDAGTAGAIFDFSFGVEWSS